MKQFIKAIPPKARKSLSPSKDKGHKRDMTFCDISKPFTCDQKVTRKQSMPFGTIKPPKSSTFIGEIPKKSARYPARTSFCISHKQCFSNKGGDMSEISHKSFGSLHKSVSELRQKLDERSMYSSDRPALVMRDAPIVNVKTTFRKTPINMAHLKQTVQPPVDKKISLHGGKLQISG
jgi:hypothetical protein